MGSHTSHVADEGSGSSTNSIQKFGKKNAQTGKKKGPTVGSLVSSRIEYSGIQMESSWGPSFPDGFIH